MSKEFTWGIFMEVIRERTSTCEIDITKVCKPDIQSVMCRHCYQFEKALRNGEQD
jgi:hypothetical protein